MNEFSISAAIIIISAEGKVLILQRNANDSFANKWTVPGGKMNEGDGDFTSGMDICYYPSEFSAIREVKEETGVIIKHHELRFLCTLYLRKINRFIVSYYTVSEMKADDISVSLSGSQDYRWVSRDEIKNYEFIPDIGSEIEAVYRLLDKT
jgi:8-oxo-dGTP pyrophosphatase MutT (NUDIX family)